MEVTKTHQGQLYSDLLEDDCMARFWDIGHTRGSELSQSAG
jgi:hypothetical protein